MKRFIAALCLALTIAIPTTVVTTGCRAPTQQKFAVNSLTTSHLAVDAVLDGYLDLVIAGKLSTNNTPIVMKAYGAYQASYNSALALVLGNTNAPVPYSVNAAAAEFTTTVNKAKTGGL